MDAVDIVIVLILALDFVLSIWNSYASGFNFRMLRRKGTDASNFMLIYCVLGLMLGVIGTIYVLAIAIGFVLFAMSYISYDAIALLLAYNFLIFGGLITFLGIGLTIQSWVIAAKTHNKWAIVSAGWNTFASIWNVFNYIREFSLVTSIIKAESKEEKNTVWVIIVFVTAIVLALILSYIAFRAGSKKAEERDDQKTV